MAESTNLEVDNKCTNSLEKDFNEIASLLEDATDDWDFVIENFESGDFKCQFCDKICASKGGLKLHTAKKHFHKDSLGEQKLNLELEDLVVLVEKTVEKICEKKLYSEECLDELLKYKENLKCDNLNLLARDIPRHKNVEKFYTSYYGTILKNAEKYFPELSSSSGKVLAMKLCDILPNTQSYLSSVNTEQGTTRSISERELAGLQYLSGYVIQNLYKKFKNNKNYRQDEYQQTISILAACKAEPSEIKNMKLVTALNRGGLWFVSDEVQKIFVIAEKKLSLYLQKDVRKIEIENISQQLASFSYVKDYFNTITEKSDIKPCKKVADSLLLSMLELYCKVRAFSFAKGIVEQHKFDLKKAKAKSLRKEMKKQ